MIERIIKHRLTARCTPEGGRRSTGDRLQGNADEAAAPRLKLRNQRGCSSCAKASRFLHMVLQALPDRVIGFGEADIDEAIGSI